MAYLSRRLATIATDTPISETLDSLQPGRAPDEDGLERLRGAPSAPSGLAGQSRCLSRAELGRSAS